MKAVQYGFKRWSIYANFTVRKAKDGEDADFNIYFKSSADEPLLNKNTIMIHYYPINSLTNPNRGKCIINTDFFYTDDGADGTMDIDSIICHEFGHGFGLPHDGVKYTIMYYSVGGMSEYPTKRCVARIQGKMGKTTKSPSRIRRWLRWLFVKSENY